ncbi:MAG TPA: hypothetical protein VFN23_01255 [Ktedonobacteraceae bacterium]|nr:hypothetical protein [Ktedonobacteraceae bacterium]
MLSLWNWFIGHIGIILALFSSGVVIGVAAFLTLRGQRQGRHLSGKNSRLEQKAQRNQSCAPLLYSLHELAPVIAELRKAHDDLSVRTGFLFQSNHFLEGIDPLLKTSYERALSAANVLSIDPAGKRVIDAYLAYLNAQNEYVQAILKPMRNFHTRFFGKTDMSLLDELKLKADSKQAALEEAIRVYVDSPPNVGQAFQNRELATFLPTRLISQITYRWRK